MLRPSVPVLAALAAAAAPVVHAWWRVACAGPLVQERIDPIVSPGVIGSNHVHTVEGASNFADNSTFDTLRASSCSSCEVFPQDLSNYWYPKLYFQDPKTGLFDAVDNGGLLVYYLDRGNPDKNNGGPGLVAFPAGFKMISGNPTRRSANYTPLSGSQGELAQRAIQWACLRYTSTAGYDYTIDYPNYQMGFPNTTCEAGLNMRVQFQSCWDGVNLDSPDHQSHVAYMSELDNGACPDDHPVGLMHLFYEVTWNVNQYVENGRWNNVTEPWPFVFATGDPTGYSWHGDFQNGWDVDILQDAINNCTNPNNPDQAAGDTAACPYFNVTSASTASECTIAPVVDEPITGNLTNLPGCNPIQPGPGNATLYSTSDCPI